MADPRKWSLWDPGAAIADADKVPGLQSADNVIWTWGQVWTYISGKLAASLALLAPLASPALTGAPTAPTAATTTNTTQLATTAFVQTEIGGKAPLASPAFTGNPTAPTPAAADNDTSVATTAFVQGELKSRTWHVVAHGATAVATTGTTSETAQLDVTIPGGSLGPNGQVRVRALWSATNNANTKQTRIRFGAAGVAGTVVQAINATSIACVETLRSICNRNAQNSQVVFPSTQGAFGTVTTAVTTMTIDTSADFHVVLTCTPFNTGDTITLESWTIEICYGA